MSRILNIDIISVTRKSLLSTLSEGVLLTPNVDHLVRLQKDREFYNAYKGADWIVCDSMIVYRLSCLLKEKIVEPIPGSTFFHEFCDFHRTDDDTRIFILGGKEGVPQQARRNINERVGREMVVGAYSPSFSFVEDRKESEGLVDMIRESGATVLMVCATSPKQEVWIARYRDALPDVRLFMALGATVDFEAGSAKRCPVLFQRLGMEWFWRFCHEPRRLFRRYFLSDMRFFWYFGKQLLGCYQDPFAS